MLSLYTEDTRRLFQLVWYKYGHRGTENDNSLETH